MNEAGEALTFSSSALLISSVLGMVKSQYLIHAKLIPIITAVLVVGWGLVLWVSDYWDGNAANFIITSITVWAAASGVQSITRTYVPDALQVGPNANLPTPGSKVDLALQSVGVEPVIESVPSEPIVSETVAKPAPRKRSTTKATGGTTKSESKTPTARRRPAPKPKKPIEPTGDMN